MRKSVFFVSAGLVLSGLASIEIRAAIWWPLPLRSLVFDSKYLALAEETGQRTASNNGVLRTYRVKKVYKGPLVPGQKIEVFDSYPRTHPWKKSPAQKFDPEVVLFLEDVTSKTGKSSLFRNLKPEEIPRHSIVHSGLRLLRGDEVYTFHQTMNPGPIAPALEYRSRSEFEKELLSAVHLVESYRAALKLKNGDSRRKKILALLEAYQKRARELKEKDAWSTYSDKLLMEIVKNFLVAGDVQNALETMARTRCSGFGVSRSKLMEAALNKEYSAEQRAVAIESLDRTTVTDEEAILPGTGAEGDGWGP